MPYSSLVDLHFLAINEKGFDSDLNDALELLDASEKKRFQRFKNEHAQSCFLQARRIAKIELAKKLGCEPNEVNFQYSEKDKPLLDNSQGWHFNISHSRSSIAVAIASKPVGVDVEDIDRCIHVWDKADDFLNEHVKKQVDKCENEWDAASVFAEHWCCTESYIKQKGSAIYLDKGRVEAEIKGRFDMGKYYQFENICFTVFDYDKSFRMSLAYPEKWPNINFIDWSSKTSTNFIPEN